MLLNWNELPDQMKTKEVKPYYEILRRKRRSLLVKRTFDIFAASAMTIVLVVPMVIIAAAVKIDSKGPVIYRQERVTTYGKVFKIHKFRTMVDKADTIPLKKLLEREIEYKKNTIKLHRSILEQISNNETYRKLYSKLLNGKTPSKAVEEVVNENYYNNIKPYSESSVWRYYSNLKKLFK